MANELNIDLCIPNQGLPTIVYKTKRPVVPCEKYSTASKKNQMTQICIYMFVI